MPAIRALKLVPLLLAAPLPGAELVMRDLRVGLERLPADFTYEIHDSTAKRSGSDAFDSAYGLIVGGAYSFARAGVSNGPYATLAATCARYAHADGAMTDYGARLGGGWAWAISDRWSAMAGVDLGGGAATLDLSDAVHYPDFSASGIWVGYAADVGVGYAFTDHLLATLAVAWSTTSHALSGSGVDTTIDATGLRVGLIATWRFSVTPWRLE